MATRKPTSPDDDPNADPAEQAEQSLSASRPPQPGNGEDGGDTEASSPVIVNR